MRGHVKARFPPISRVQYWCVPRRNFSGKEAGLISSRRVIIEPRPCIRFVCDQLPPCWTNQQWQSVVCGAKIRKEVYFELGYHMRSDVRCILFMTHAFFFFQFWSDTGTDADKGKNSKIKILG